MYAQAPFWSLFCEKTLPSWTYDSLQNARLTLGQILQTVSTEMTGLLRKAKPLQNNPKHLIVGNFVLHHISCVIPVPWSLFVLLLLIFACKQDLSCLAIHHFCFFFTERDLVSLTGKKAA